MTNNITKIMIDFYILGALLVIAAALIAIAMQRSERLDLERDRMKK